MSAMRRAQRIVRLESQVTLAAIDWNEARERWLGAEIGDEGYGAASHAYDGATERLEQAVQLLVQELDTLAVPS